MSEGSTHKVLARKPLRHWGLERNEVGEITIGDGTEGTVTQADFDGRLELGHAAIVDADGSDDGEGEAEAPAKKATRRPAAGKKDDQPPLTVADGSTPA